MSITVNDTIFLEFLETVHAPALINLVNENRNYLKEWLPWVDQMQSVENAEQYITDCNRRATSGTDFAYAIISDNNMVGRIGMHHINRQNRIGEIGYWLAGGMQGRGIITSCCKGLIHYGFTELGLHRIEIKCGTGNHKSRHIAEKLQFKKEGILRQAEMLNGVFIDLCLYALLKDEWEQSNR